MRNWHTTEVIREEPKPHSGFAKKFIDIFYPKQKATIAELSKEEFIAYRALAQGNQITRGCAR